MTQATHNTNTARAISPQALLARADLLIVLIDLLRSPAAGDWPRQPLPDAASLRELLAAAELGDTAELSSHLNAALREAQSISREALSDEHHRLFEGAMPCPLNETAYIRRDKGAIIGDLAGFYRAFGFTPDPRSGEKADHLLTELELVAILLILCAQAPGNEQRDIAERALASFAAAHPGDWLPAVCARLAELTRLPLFAHTSAALLALWNALVRVHAWPITPSTATASGADEEPESPYECDAGSNAEPLVPLHARGQPL